MEVCVYKHYTFFQKRRRYMCILYNHNLQYLNGFLATACACWGIFIRNKNSKYSRRHSPRTLKCAQDVINILNFTFIYYPNITHHFDGVLLNYSITTLLVMCLVYKQKYPISDLLVLNKILILWLLKVTNKRKPFFALNNFK